MQTKSTHSWLWYAFYSPQIFKVESFLWSGSMLLSALRCCCSLPWQAQLLALCSFRKLLTFQEEKETQEWLLGKAWDCKGGCPDFSLRKHAGFPQLLFCCLLMWRTWKWWTQWWLYENRTQIKESELFPLLFGLAYYNNLQVLCYFLRARFCVKKPHGWGGWKKHDTKIFDVLRWVGTYIINFFLCMCTSYLLLRKGQVISSFSKGFFNVDDRCRDDRTNYQALTWKGFVVHFWTNSVQPPQQSKFNKR